MCLFFYLFISYSFPCLFLVVNVFKVRVEVQIVLYSVSCMKQITMQPLKCISLAYKIQEFVEN